MRLDDAPSGSLFVNSRNHRAAYEIESATTAPTARGGPSLPFHIHSEQLKKIAFDPAICTSFRAMRRVLGVAESTVLKYMIQSHELRTPSMHHRTDRDDGQTCGSLRHRKGAGAAVAGYTLTLTICSDFWSLTRAIEAWYRLPLQTLQPEGQMASHMGRKFLARSVVLRPRGRSRRRAGRKRRRSRA
jgi:hypothetical protein